MTSAIFDRLEEVSDALGDLENICAAMEVVILELGQLRIEGLHEQRVIQAMTGLRDVTKRQLQVVVDRFEAVYPAMRGGA